MNIGSFGLARLPRILFGEGRLAEIPALLQVYGRHVLLVTGGRSFTSGPYWPALKESISAAGMVWDIVAVAAEPSPQLVDDTVSAFRKQGIDVVLGIGGGSVLDAAKAVAGLLPHGNSVMDHLEGVGKDIPYRGPATPFIAVPTTAGTGSEATRNAVLSVQGQGGFKKSFRHDALVPRVAVVDPLLLANCPPELIAANGMDALTQLIESYVSSRANPLTDALAWSGLEAVRDGLIAAWRGGDSDSARAGRTCMAYGALISGITLAQVGLGSVHGLASPLGAYYPIPHGVACGTLLAPAVSMNIRALRERLPDSPALEKYARLGRLLGNRDAGAPREQAWEDLVRILGEWTEQLMIPKLGVYGLQAAGVEKVVAGSRGSSMQTNPVRLGDAEIAEIVTARLA